MVDRDHAYRHAGKELAHDVGAGGVGGAFAAALAKGGSDVAFLARGAHLKAMLQRGLKVLDPRD